MTEEDRVAKKREQQRLWNKRRYEKETPEAREKRLQASREAALKRYYERKAKEPQKPKPAPKSNDYPQRVKKPGRLCAMAGWLKW